MKHDPTVDMTWTWKKVIAIILCFPVFFIFVVVIPLGEWIFNEMKAIVRRMR